MRRAVWGCLWGLLACAPRMAPDASAPPTLCESAQRELSAIAPSAEVATCRLEPRGQVVARAEIAIDGAEAAALEQHLRRTYGLAPLTFACCGWESQPVHKATAPDGTTVLISLHSDETLVTDRAAWSTVPRFWVVVERVDV